MGTCFAGQQGFLSRFEGDAIINATGTDIAAMVYYAPGILNNTSGVGAYNSYGFSNAAITSDTAANTWNAGLLLPGASFLQANSRSVRCVAACLQISYPGAELTRAGIAALGQADFGDVYSGGSAAVSNLRTLAQKVTRLPDGTLEVKLVPNPGSERWMNPNVGLSASTIQGWQDSPTLFATVSGIPTSVGIRVRLVAVYEWLPLLGVGLATPSLSVPPSAISLNGVLNSLARTGEWMYEGFENAGRAFGAMGRAYVAGSRLTSGIRTAAPLLLGM
jgi:hypothetical protein